MKYLITIAAIFLSNSSPLHADELRLHVGTSATLSVSVPTKVTCEEAKRSCEIQSSNKCLNPNTFGQVYNLQCFAVFLDQKLVSLWRYNHEEALKDLNTFRASGLCP